MAALPPELASISEPEERVIEYLHYRQFFNIWDILDRVVECQAREVLPMSKDAQSSWLNDYKVSGREEKIKSVSDLGKQGLISQARKHILRLLTSDWLVTDVEKSGGECHWHPLSVVIPESNLLAGDRRRRELIRIRQIYIPELIIRLHSLLLASRRVIPE